MPHPSPIPLDSPLDAHARRAVLDAIARHGSLDGALLPVLHAIQDVLGWIPPAAVTLIAEGLNLSRAEVHGVISFYHRFRSTPPGRHVLQLCRAEACQAVGAVALERHACARLGVDFHGTTADGAITLEPVYCLGNCASGPSLMVGEELHGRMTAERFDALVEAMRDTPPRPIPASATRAGVRPMQPMPVGIGSTHGLTPVSQGRENSVPTRPFTSPSPAQQGRAGEGSNLRTKVYLPRDATALALGADAVAAAIEHEARERNIAIELVRTGSRGAFWLEPLVEVAHDGGRLAYGPVNADEVPALFDAGFPQAAQHALALGPVDAIPWLAHQRRVSFARCGVVDPVSVADYRAHGGFAGLERALTLSSEDLITAVTESGLRGRGGAAFPAGIKWRTARDTPADRRYVVANADEGDSGTFADRVLMEGDPFALIEGMSIAGLAIGAERGIIYLRCEYPHAERTLLAALDAARAHGLLGPDLLGSGRAFDIELRRAAGAYICGEETSLLESLEGRRGQVRYKPPVPAQKGLFGKPTLVHNVVTLAAVPAIIEHGAAWYRALGCGRSHGTLPLQLAGNIRRGGLVEAEFGITLRELLVDYGGGSASGRPLRAVQVGGPLGAYLPESQFDTPIDYEAFAAIGAMLGHGGVVAFDDTVDMAAQARFAMEFCAIESCGKCTPCRIGSVRGVETIDRLRAGGARANDEALLRELCDTMLNGSLCALGGMAPYPVLSALDHFGGDFAAATTNGRHPGERSDGQFARSANTLNSHPGESRGRGPAPLETIEGTGSRRTPG